MKIAIVCLNLKWQAGGTRLIFSLAHALRKQNHVVRIYTPEFNDQAYPELRAGLDIVVIPPRSPFSWTETEQPKSLIRRIFHKLEQERLHIDTAFRIAHAMDSDFDIVNVHDFAYRVAYFYRKINPHAKTIWTENDPPILYLPKANFLYDLLSRLFNVFKEFTEIKFFKAVDRAVVLDFFNRDWALKHKIPAFVVRSGVDFENFYAPVKDRKTNKKDVRILGFGALNRYRRFEDIIHATKILRESGYEANTFIVCKDIWLAKQYRAYLIGLVESFHLDTCVTFRFDGVSNDELRRVYQESDVYVLPTYLPPPRNGYGWGLSNFEAMAAGLPLIICRTSTATEVLTDRENALFVDPMSPDQIAEQVKLLIEDSSLYARIATAGQNFVRHNISWDKYAREMVQVFIGS